VEGGLTGGKAGGALGTDAIPTKYSIANTIVIAITFNLCILDGSDGFLNISIY
jgi:hypothetical protein